MCIGWLRQVFAQARCSLVNVHFARHPRNEMTWKCQARRAFLPTSYLSYCLLYFVAAFMPPRSWLGGRGRFASDHVINTLPYFLDTAGVKALGMRVTLAKKTDDYCQ